MISYSSGVAMQFEHARGTWRRAAMSGAGILLCALLVGVAYLELPRWTKSGAASHAVASMGHDAPGTICPQELQTVELRGDSHVIGSRMSTGKRAAAPYGVILAQTLGGGVTAQLRGLGGATAADGESRWRDTPLTGEILLLAYGTNDAAARGWIGGKTPVPMNRYRASLLRQISGATKFGVRVALIAPPPASSPAMMARLQPYRRALLQIGQEEGIPVFDPAEAFAECKNHEPLLSRDGLHLNEAGHKCLGRWLARRLCR